LKSFRLGCLFVRYVDGDGVSADDDGRELLDNYEHADEIQAIVELKRHSASAGSSQYFLLLLKVDEQS
jgi:hypothetical protein